MNPILARLVIAVTVTIGPFAASLSVDLKGKLKGDVSYTAGSLTRGVSRCLLNCNPNENGTGVGRYKKIAASGKFIGMETKFYENGTTSVDMVASAKACNKNGGACVKIALKERVADNFDKKKASVNYGQLLYNGSFKSNAISPQFSTPAYQSNFNRLIR